MGDLFHKDVSEGYILDVVIAAARTRGIGHTFMFLTKRPERMRDLFLKWIIDGLTFHEGCTRRLPSFFWLGVTAENQKRADERIPILLQIPAAVRFVSIEPMLGPVDFSHKMLGQGSDCPDHGPGVYVDEDGLCSSCGRDVMWYGLDWVIVGAETGPGRRPMEIDWALSVRDQCKATGVPFFFKKDSLGKHTLDGKIYEQWPK
jgi:protein gp37